jgi:peroxiredoxin
MRKLVLILGLIFCVSLTFAQHKELKNLGKLPDVTIKDINGNIFSTSKITNDGKPIIITFWATWCKPCIKEHDAINEVYEDWVKETGVKLYAVSIDNSRSSSRVKPTVDGRSWEFDILTDVNQDLKRAMNVNEPPHTFILDGTGTIRWQHVGYMDGGEAEYIQVVKQILNEKK